MKAVDLWDLLLKNSYNRNEPGILFIDKMRKYDNLHYLPNCGVNSPNPCSEVFGSVGSVNYNNEEVIIGDVCNLGSLNVTKFYNVKTKEFDGKTFQEATALMVRALDNIIDISNYPLKQYEDSAKLRRKIGVGLTGIGSLFMMMNIKYGSEDSVKFAETLFQNFMNSLYKESALLAKEKGPFPLYSNSL